ncbi:hypothetical protein BGZ50_000304, partial [Haplosporangium sp. Z 11]
MAGEHQQPAPSIQDEHNNQQYINEYIAPPPHSFISPAGHVSSLPSTATGYTMPSSLGSIPAPPKVMSPPIIVTSATTQDHALPPTSVSSLPPPPSNPLFKLPATPSSSSTPTTSNRNNHTSPNNSNDTSSTGATTTTVSSSMSTAAIVTATALSSTLSQPLISPWGDQGARDAATHPPTMTIETYRSPGTLPESVANDSNSINTGHYYEHSNGTVFDSASTSQRNSQDADNGSSEARISLIFANEKRFSDFHALFRSVPEDEKLIEDYGCALQKEILVQGRLYISENHVCFNANIFGWVTNLVISFSEITAIEKRLTAFVIPNAISIVTTTNTKGHFFASFLSRDAAHDLLMAAWRKSFPCAANAPGANYSNNNSNNSNSSISGSTTGNSYQQLKNRSRSTINDEDDTNDAQSFISARSNSESRRNRHRRSFSNASQPWSGEESKDEGIKVNSDRPSKRAVVRKILKDAIAPIISDDSQRNGNLSPDSGNKRKGRPRSVSELPPRPAPFDGVANQNTTTVPRISTDQNSLLPPIQRARAGTESLPLPRTVAHSTTALRKPPSSSPLAPKPLTAQPAATESSRTPTTCQCSKDGRHYTNLYLSETYPGSVESLWKLLFDSDFSKGFLTSEAMKGADVQEEPWQESSTDGTSTKVTRYTRWLGMPIGPKTTKAILTDVCEYKNFDMYVTTVTTTSTPDVPSGGSFTTKVRTCITWAGPNQVRIVVTGAVEFTKSSWVKGQIEKGAAEGMTFHYKELNQSLRKHIATHPKEFTGAGAAAAISTAPKAIAVESSTPAKDTVHRRRPAQPATALNSSSQPRAVQSPVQNANGSTKADHKTNSASDAGLLSGLSKYLPRNSGST